MSKLHRDYLGFRLYRIGEDGFARDREGRYVVHVLFSEIGSPHLHTIRIPNCLAATSEEAEKLSWQHGMRSIEERVIPMPKPRTLALDLTLLAMSNPENV